MDIIESILKRRSIRSYKPEPVYRKVLEELIDTCRWSPSAQNSQPWELVVIGGDVMEKVRSRLVKRVDEEWDEVNFKFRKAYPDVPHKVMTGVYHDRAMQTRDLMDQHQFPAGTEKLQEKRRDYLLNSAGFYGAPNAIFLSIDKALYPKLLLDIGLFTQSLCLVALNYGLSTCITSMAVFWPDILRELLAIPDSKLIVVAVCIGYAHKEASVNTFERVRAPLEESTYWHGF